MRKETEARIRDDLAAWFAERERLRKTPYRGASNQYDPARDEETHVRDRMLASAMAVNDGRETSDEIRALAVMMARVVIEVRLVRSTKRSSGS